MRKLITTALLAAGLLAVNGCSAVPGFVANSLGLPVETKVVMSKMEPAELVAIDATTCSVSRRRFADVDLGDRVACFWSEERRPELPLVIVEQRGPLVPY